MRSPARALASAASGAMIAAILLYRYTLSGALGRSCRFVPTCSQYAIAVIRLHGPLRGGWLTARRLARCHPLGGHGFDPPPAATPPRSAPASAAHAPPPAPPPAAPPPPPLRSSRR